MKLNDQFRFVRQNMKKNKTRVMMTILATAMGCAFLIVLASVGFGLHKSIVKEMTEQRIVTEIDVYGKQEENGNFLQLKDKDIQYFEGINDVKAVTRQQMLQQEGNYSIDGYEALSHTVVTHMPSEVKAGFELSKGRLPENPKEIIVGYHFAQSLRLSDSGGEDYYGETGNLKEKFAFNQELVNENITLTVRQNIDGEEKTKSIPLTIVGVGKKPTREWLEDRTVFISQEILKEVEEFTGTPRGMIIDSNNGDFQPDIAGDTYDSVKIYANNLEEVKGISETIKSENYQSYSVINELENVNKVFIIIKSGLVFIGTIAIIIASIGIYNTMTMAVTERAPDIGIMKALGANPKTIKRIFLLESSYIGLIGAIIGTAVSYGISTLVNFALPLIISSTFNEESPEGLMFSHIPWSLPLICVVICYLVTILSGLRPAQRATKVDVLKAMRREV